MARTVGRKVVTFRGGRTLAGRTVKQADPGEGGRRAGIMLGNFRIGADVAITDPPKQIKFWKGVRGTVVGFDANRQLIKVSTPAGGGLAGGITLWKRENLTRVGTALGRLK